MDPIPPFEPIPVVDPNQVENATPPIPIPIPTKFLKVHVIPIPIPKKYGIITPLVASGVKNQTGRRSKQRQHSSNSFNFNK